MKRINERDILLAGGNVLIGEPVIFRPIEDYKPPVNTSLLVIVDDPDQSEFVQEFAQVDKRGNWKFISGDTMPLPRGHSVVYWGEVPKFPTRIELQAVRS